MTKIYHNDSKCILMDKPPCDKPDGGRSLQQRILAALAASVKIIYDVHELWFYTDGVFESYKLRDTDSQFLPDFMKANGIDIYRTSEPSSNGHTVVYCFATPQDEFKFRLKL